MAVIHTKFTKFACSSQPDTDGIYGGVDSGGQKDLYYRVTNGGVAQLV